MTRRFVIRALVSLVILVGVTAWKLTRPEPLPTLPLPSYVTQIEGYEQDPATFDAMFQGACVRVARLNGNEGSAFEARDIDPIKSREQILTEMALVAEKVGETDLARRIRLSLGDPSGD
jgi:hypothetical protein